MSVCPIHPQTSVQAAGQHDAHVSGRLPRSGAVRQPQGPRRGGECAALCFVVVVVVVAKLAMNVW